MAQQGFKVTIAFFVMFTILAIVAMTRPTEIASTIMTALIGALSAITGTYYATRGQTSG
jgi:disulfide bond formation protein DsbB